MSYRVDYTPGSHVMCRACFAVIPFGDIRVVCELPKQAYYHMAKQYYHALCRPPRCGQDEVAGLDKLREADRERVLGLMAKEAGKAPK